MSDDEELSDLDRLESALQSRGFSYGNNASILNLKLSDGVRSVTVTTRRIPESRGMRTLTWGLFKRSESVDWHQAEVADDNGRLPPGLLVRILGEVDRWIGTMPEDAPAANDRDSLVRICERAGLARVGEDVWNQQGRTLQKSQFLASAAFIMVGSTSFSFDENGRTQSGG